MVSAVVHFEREDQAGTACSLDYGDHWPGEVVDDPEEIHDVTCADCLGAVLELGW